MKIFGGYEGHDRKHVSLPEVAQPSREAVGLLLQAIREQRCGSAVAQFDPEPKRGPRRMELVMQEGRYVVVVNISLQDNEAPDPCLALFNGDWRDDVSNVLCWCAFGQHEIFLDFDVVAEAFEKFVLTGEIDREKYLASFPSE